MIHYALRGPIHCYHKRADNSHKSQAGNSGMVDLKQASQYTNAGLTTNTPAHCIQILAHLFQPTPTNAIDTAHIQAALKCAGHC